MEKVIVMIPTWAEAKRFITRYGDICETAKAGIGLAECGARTAGIIASRKPDMLILAGFAGAYEGRGITKGETVLVMRENSSDLGSFGGKGFMPLSKDGGDPMHNYYDCPAPLPEIFPKVTSNSVNTAMRCGDAPFGAEIENMEGAAFFAVCNILDIPFLEIRTISNMVGEERSRWIMDEAAELLSEGIKKTLDHIEENTQTFFGKRIK